MIPRCNGCSFCEQAEGIMAKQAPRFTIDFWIKLLVWVWNESASRRLDLGTWENQTRFCHWFIIRSWRDEAPTSLLLSLLAITTITSQPGMLISFCSPYIKHKKFNEFREFSHYFSFFFDKINFHILEYQITVHNLLNVCKTPFHMACNEGQFHADER